MGEFDRDEPKQMIALDGVVFHWIQSPLPRLTRWFSRIGLRGIFAPQWSVRQLKMAERILVSNIRPDILYVQRWGFGMVGWLLGRLLGAKVVIRHYGTWLYYYWFEQRNWIPRIKNIGSLLGYLLPADLVILLNDGTNADKIAKWLRIPESRYRFWLSGVNKEMRIPGFDGAAFKKQLGMSPDAPMLLQLGRLDTWKRQDRLIDAMPMILGEFPDARLVLVGTGPLRKELEKRAKDIGVSEAVVFAGEVGHDEIIKFLNTTDLYVQGQDLSNLSNTIIEALAAGCCIITRDVGATTEMITDGQNAVVLKPGEADDFADAVIRLLKNPDERSRLADAAYAYAMENFQTWDERLDMEIDLIEQIRAGKSK
jgi:glycosyltransferase involved in cell wall biosynthesis